MMSHDHVPLCSANANGTRRLEEHSRRRPAVPAGDGCSSPELVTRGESQDSQGSEAIACHDQIVDGEAVLADPFSTRVIRVPQPVADVGKTAHIDWLAFSFQGSDTRTPEWLRLQLQEVFNLPADAWKYTSKGWMGYEKRVDLGDCGLSAYGGERQRGTIHVELNAQGCAHVLDWHLVQAWGEAIGARVTRIDLAHDDFDGLTVNIETVLDWYKGGGFSTNGRPPKARLVDDFGSGDGKTLYVGKRANGKLCRCYEKGREQGDKDSPWFRVEVEWRHQSRVLPWEMVTSPGPYLAGAYPCLRFLSTHQDKVATVQREGALNYTQMVKWVRSAAGPALNVMTYAHQGDMESVLREVIRDGCPRRLKNVSTFLPEILPRRPG